MIEVYPLNSTYTRLHILQIHKLSQAQNIPTLDDLQIMIEGKLKEINHTPMNVQFSSETNI